MKKAELTLIVVFLLLLTWAIFYHAQATGKTITGDVISDGALDGENQNSSLENMQKEIDGLRRSLLEINKTLDKKQNTLSAYVSGGGYEYKYSCASFGTAKCIKANYPVTKKILQCDEGSTKILTARNGYDVDPDPNIDFWESWYLCVKES